MELVLIRHGLPEHVETNDGSPADPPLSEQGLEQAGKMAKYLADNQFDRIYSSPMRRAYETAQPLASSLGRKIEICEGVAEFDQQARSYIPVEKLKKENYQQWKKLMNGGYSSSVNFDAFAETVSNSLNEIVNANKGKRIAVACHGGVINAWAAHVVGFKPKLFFNPEYTSINRFMIASTGEKSVISLNLAVHLD